MWHVGEKRRVWVEVLIDELKSLGSGNMRMRRRSTYSSVLENWLKSK